MSTKNNPELVADIEHIAAELDQANHDVALLKRLKSAEERAKRLAGELRAAQDALAEAAAADIEAKLDARFAAFSDLRIGEVAAENSNGTVLGYTYPITVTRMAFNGRESLPTPKTYQGFETLPPDVMEYLVERRSDRIPARIMALAPTDPDRAIAEYLMQAARLTA